MANFIECVQTSDSCSWINFTWLSTVTISIAIYNIQHRVLKLLDIIPLKNFQSKHVSLCTTRAVGLYNWKKLYCRFLIFECWNFLKTNLQLLHVRRFIFAGLCVFINIELLFRIMLVINPWILFCSVFIIILICFAILVMCTCRAPVKSSNSYCRKNFQTIYVLIQFTSSEFEPITYVRDRIAWTTVV